MIDSKQSSLNLLGDSEFDYLKDLVYKATGIFLAPHKKIMVQSRLNSRLRTLNIDTFTEYVNKLKREPSFAKDEFPEIINKITTNKTDFFRENHHFEFLKTTFFPLMEKEAQETGNRVIRIWCSASSTGEEPYSIAVTAQEYFAHKPGFQVKIIASDIDTNVLNTAKQGIYKAERLEPVSEALKTKYFTKTMIDKSPGYEAKPILKSMIEFRQINLLVHPYPIRDKQDLIFCRNVIIYFDKPTQKNIFSYFEETLKPMGHLIIGHSETMFGISDSFKFLGHTVYRKKT